MSAYLDRMKELQTQTRANNINQSRAVAGLPLHRPGSDESLVPPFSGESPKPQEDEAYKNSHFFMNFDYHRQNDPHFDSMVGELTHLSSALRDQVQQGYMPARLAKQRVIQYVTDTMAHYNRNAPQIQKADSDQQLAQAQGALLNQMSQAAQASQAAPQQAPQPSPADMQASYMSQVKKAPQVQGGMQNQATQAQATQNQQAQANAKGGM